MEIVSKISNVAIVRLIFNDGTKKLERIEIQKLVDDVLRLRIEVFSPFKFVRDVTIKGDSVYTPRKNQEVEFFIGEVVVKGVLTVKTVCPLEYGVTYGA